MKTNSSMFLALAAASATLLTLGCAPANFTSTGATPNQQSQTSTPTPPSAPTPTPAPPSSCTGTTVGAITRETKIIFVVDQSGSNSAPTMNAGMDYCDPSVQKCTPATDPNKTFRGGAIQNFFNKYQQKTNFQWGFISFAGDGAQSFINHGRTFITSSTSEFQNAIQTFYNTPDEDATPYRSALRMARNAIQTDGDLNSSNQPQYFVIFLTDGFPTDYTSYSGSFDSAGMQKDLSSLLSVAPGRVSLSAVYYGQADDPNAMALLQAMAKAGGGQFARAADTSTAINIDDVIPGSQQGCP